MSNADSAIRGVSDTSRWVAYFRALESKRSDAIFVDRFAERLAGERGFHIAATLPDGNKHEWAWVARTYLFDHYLTRAIRNGADVVINLAAGLDARPYRMELPASLLWVEVDLPEVVSYKADVLKDEKPACRLERVALDLSDLETRHQLFTDLNQRATRAVVASEGLLIYFTAEQVASLATELARSERFTNWIIDLASPGQLKLMQRTTGKQLGEAGAPFRFGPPEGVEFFLPYGWIPEETQGLLKTASKLKRAPQELLSLLPEPERVAGNYPWTGVSSLRRP